MTPRMLVLLMLDGAVGLALDTMNVPMARRLDDARTAVYWKVTWQERRFFRESTRGASRQVVYYREGES